MMPLTLNHLFTYLEKPMPVRLDEVARNLPLPRNVTARVQYHLDGIELWRDGKSLGVITRAQIDDNMVAKRLKELLA